MRIEHIGLNVADPVAAAEWYVRHLGFRVVRQTGAPANCRFLADECGTMIEIYHNAAAAVPDYASQNPLVLHLAFTCDDVHGKAQGLVGAGAKLVSVSDPGAPGDALAMLRDPWGLAIQLVRRNPPMAR